MAGCAIHYTDKETGARHVWGIGHMVMRMERNGPIVAVVQKTETVGVSIGNVEGAFRLSLGLDQSVRVDVANDRSVCLNWPRGSLLNVRVGREWSNYVEEDPQPRGCR